MFPVESTSRGQPLTTPAQPLSYLSSIFENPEPQLQLKISISTHEIISHFTRRQDTYKDTRKHRLTPTHTLSGKGCLSEPLGHRVRVWRQTRQEQSKDHHLGLV